MLSTTATVRTPTPPSDSGPTSAIEPPPCQPSTLLPWAVIQMSCGSPAAVLIWTDQVGTEPATAAPPLGGVARAVPADATAWAGAAFPTWESGGEAASVAGGEVVAAGVGVPG